MTRRFIPSVPTLPEGYSSVNKYTAGVFHAYADSSRPDDSGNGLSWATAKKTLEAAVAVLPDVAEDHVVLHLKGTFDISGSYVALNITMRGSGKYVLIDGGDEVNIIDGPYTATSGTTTSITDTARSWSQNALRGYFVEILDGPAAGYRYPIQSNTADTLVVGKTWTAPGTSQYRIISPATEISASSTAYFYYIGQSGHAVQFQRLFVGANIYLGSSAGICLCNAMTFSSIILSTSTSRIVSYGPGSINFWYVLHDPDDPSSNLNTAKSRCGVSHLDGGTGTPLSLNYVNIIIYGPNVLNSNVSSTDAKNFRITSGNYIRSITATNASALLLGYSSSYGTDLKIGDGTTIGVNVKNSSVVVDKNMAIQNCGSHAFQLDNSTLECQDAVLSGSGNAGAGVYLKNRSSVIFKEGYMPTLTGTAGDIAVTSETEADATWAQVAAGDPVEIMPDGSVKEVP